MTRVKVCGVTNLEDALWAVEAGADALGFIFAPSPRQVAADQARSIIRSLPPFVTTVGVFADAPRDYVHVVVEESGVQLIQLHGDEAPEYGASLSRGVIQRIRVEAGDSAAELQSKLRGYDVAAYLLDPGAGGGRAFDWTLVAEWADRPCGATAATPVSVDAMSRPVLVLAGGLNAGNVGDAIRIARPFAVDVCSGVEDRPGKKDRQKLRVFVRAVREADALYAS